VPSVSSVSPSVESSKTCDGGSFFLQLLTDKFGLEITWTLSNEDTNDEVLSGGPYGNNQLIQVDECIMRGCYEFVILDSGGDGICCSYEEGYYAITVDEDVVQESDGTYGSSENVKFCSIETANPASVVESQPSPTILTIESTPIVSETIDPTQSPSTSGPTPIMSETIEPTQSSSTSEPTPIVSETIGPTQSSSIN